MTKYESFFDNTLKPLMLKALRNPEVDGPSRYYIGQALWYIEHDLNDRRNPVIRILPVAGCLQDEQFYKLAYTGKEDSEAVKLLREIGKKAQEFKDLCLKIEP